ncbi:hypothetical protein AVEN_54495-1 [Araneus ventricosus]|uniref:Histone-lysine N-methyltransferase SETMAR n=1 Tax=Araneus ventricosus TaxID=182803 RepID=A0A4Y2W1Q1_ARAVE|nr:hypothetical protein AVEN_54495-1 [Araneus ventricosus]
MAGVSDGLAKCELYNVFAFLKQKVGLWKTIDAAIFCQTLRRLRRAILTSGVVLIHDNACPHSGVVIQSFWNSLKGTCLILGV